MPVGIAHTAESLAHWGVGLVVMLGLLSQWAQQHDRTTTFKARVAAVLEISYYSGPAGGEATARMLRDKTAGAPDQSVPTTDSPAPQEGPCPRPPRREQP